MSSVRLVVTRILDFYRGQGPDDAGRTIVTVWGFDTDTLEWRHDFIQWLFPLRSRSGANPGAPTLADQDVAAFQADEALRQRLLRSFDLMLAFYGFVRDGEGATTVVQPGPGFEARLREWVTPGNHNFLRISRILRSLATLGLTNESHAFLVALLHLCDGPAGTVIGPRSRQFWVDAVSGD
ncbi:MAG: opioid growth factor receptor-related protein [Vicinamibacterales bacterium]